MNEELKHFLEQLAAGQVRLKEDWSNAGDVFDGTGDAYYAGKNDAKVLLARELLSAFGDK